MIDLAEFSGSAYGEFIVQLGATDVALAVFKVMQSETKTNSTTLGGSPTEVLDVTTKPDDGDSNGVWVIGIDLRTVRARYIQLQVTAGDGSAGTYLSAIFQAIPGESGTTAALRNASNVEYV